MITRQTLAEKRAEILRLAAARCVGEVRVFGSVARGESTAASDVDFLVRPLARCSLLDLGGLLMDLQDLLGCKVDVVTEDGLKPRLRQQVLAETVRV